MNHPTITEPIRMLDRELHRLRDELRIRREGYERLSAKWEQDRPALERTIAELEDAITALGGNAWRLEEALGGDVT